MPKMNRRTYSSVLPYFHNFEHDPNGLRHCTGGSVNPYIIEHLKGKHIIDREYARGHGKGGKPQWFKFTRRLDNGYDLLSGVKVKTSEVPVKYKCAVEIMDRNRCTSEKIPRKLKGIKKTESFKRPRKLSMTTKNKTAGQSNSGTKFGPYKYKGGRLSR